MNRVPLILLLVAMSLGGCFFRLSDPIYAVKPLRATEPPGDEYSLVFVTIQHEGGLFATDVDTIYFRRVDPAARGTFFFTTDEFLFRVFADRSVKDGHFLVQLSPGVYELDSMERGRARWLLDDTARVASRIYITRPSVYDLGTLRLEKPGWLSKYSLVAQGDAGSPERARQLWDAVSGTSWERLVSSPRRATR
jgi:hypothetical protein